jgi:5-methylcytosine-specific restriction enzyme A
MPLLYYWRNDNYYRDLDLGAGYHLNQASPLLHEIEIGDSLWAFTRAKNGDYVLAAELIIKAKTINPPNFRYGRYRVWGDLKKSRYFKVDGQPRVEQVIRSLSIPANAEILGRAFQGHAAVRRITETDHQILSIASKNLELEPRARILPEEKLEASLLLGDETAVEELLREEKSGIAEKRKEYLYRQAPTRNRNLAKELQKIYDGKCQICLWSPRDIYGEFLCHAHHVHWLSRGGEDCLENMVLICPNHHSAIHGCDAPLNYENFSFDFGKLKEKIQLIKHSLDY